MVSWLVMQFFVKVVKKKKSVTIYVLEYHITMSMKISVIIYDLEYHITSFVLMYCGVL